MGVGGCHVISMPRHQHHQRAVEQGQTPSGAQHDKLLMLFANSTRKGFLDHPQHQQSSPLAARPKNCMHARSGSPNA